jgi:hypothetical protein
MTTPEAFYGALSNKLLADGLLNRLVIIDGDLRAVPRRDLKQEILEVPPELVERLVALYPPINDALESADAVGSDTPRTPSIIITWTAEAEQIWWDLSENLRKELDPDRRNLFSRVPEITVRFATIVAFGRFSRVVEKPDMEWARAVTLKSAEALYKGFKEHTVDVLNFNALCHQIVAVIATEEERQVAEGMELRRITEWKLRDACQRLIAKGGDFDAALKWLVQAQKIEVANNPTTARGGRPSNGWRLIKE